MQYEIISHHNMATNYETEIISTLITRNNTKQYRAVSLQIVWQNVSNQPDGVIKLFAGNRIDSLSLGKIIPISNTDNTNDAALIIQEPLFEYIKLEYIPNNITQGELTCYINYRSD